MTTPRQMEPAIVARAVNSRLRVGRLTQAGQAITLTQTDATTCGPTCLLAARLLLASGERAAVTGDLAQEMTGRANSWSPSCPATRCGSSGP